MTIKLVIADVDGTLVNRSKALTPATCDAVARLRARGVEFTITSGRPPRGMATLVEPLELTAPLAAFNGGMYVKPDLTTVLAQRTLSRDAAKEAVDYLLQAGLDVWVYRGADWYVRRLDAPRVDRERSNVGFEPIVTGDLYSLLDAPVKLVGVNMDYALVERCEAELTALLGTEACAARSQPYYLDVTHPEANKGMVVREAARILKLPLSAIATLGDMLNDVPMLRVAGMGIAMGNASAEVQRVARHVTRSNNEEGFAFAVDTFILGEPPLARTGLGLPPRVRACLFGLDGVLTQAAGLRATAWKQLFDHYLLERSRGSGLPFVPFDAARDHAHYFDRKPPADGVRAFFAARGIEVPDTTVDALVARHARVLATLLRQERVETYEASARYVRAARASGLRLAALSSIGSCREALESAGLAGLFDACIDAPPTADAWLVAALALGVGAHEAAVFEESVGGVETARAAHFGYVVGVDRHGHGGLLEHGADVVVSEVAELADDEVLESAPPPEEQPAVH